MQTHQRRQTASAPRLDVEKVLLLKCTRGGRQLHQALDAGRALDPVRAEAQDSG